MRLYTVLRRPHLGQSGLGQSGPGDTERRLVPEGGFLTALFAFVFGPLWLFYHRAFLAGLVVVLIEIGLSDAALADAALADAALADAAHIAAGSWLVHALRLTLHVGIAVFGLDLRRLELRAGGFTPDGVIAGIDADHAIFRLHERNSGRVA